MDVQPADRFSERLTGVVRTPLPARAQLGNAAEGLAGETEALVDEPFGKKVGGPFDRMEPQPVLPGIEGLGGGQGGESGDWLGVPDQEDGRVLQTGRVEQRRPIEPRGLGGQFLAFPRDHVMHVLGLAARGMHRRHPGLEREHAGGARFRGVEARQFEGGRDMRLVRLAQLGHVRIRGDIVIAVGHSETALEQVGIAARRVRQALSDPDSEEVAGLEAGIVERVDVGAEIPAQHAGEIVPVGDGGDAIELRLEGSDSLGLDGGFVHEARVEVGDFAGVPAGGGAGLGGFLNEGEGVLAGLVDQDLADAVTGFVGGNGRGLDPSAIGIGIEIVARRDGRVHAWQIDT